MSCGCLQGAALCCQPVLTGPRSRSEAREKAQLSPKPLVLPSLLSHFIGTIPERPLCRRAAVTGGRGHRACPRTLRDAQRSWAARRAPGGRRGEGGGSRWAVVRQWGQGTWQHEEGARTRPHLNTDPPTSFPSAGQAPSAAPLPRMRARRRRVRRASRPKPSIARSAGPGRESFSPRGNAAGCEVSSGACLQPPSARLGLHPAVVQSRGSSMEQPRRSLLGQPGSRASRPPRALIVLGACCSNHFPHKSVPSALPADISRFSRSPAWLSNPNGGNTRVHEIIIFYRVY